MIQPLDPSPTGSMDNRRLDSLIRQCGSEVEGSPGSWRFEAEDVAMICLSDESHDRVRIIAPITAEENLSAELALTCLEANFDRALDARYCIHDGTLWGAFIHPLSSLTDAQFTSGVRQVAEVAKNFGTTFASTGLVFGNGTNDP